MGKITDIIVRDVFSVVTTSWNGPPIRALEVPVVLVVTLYRKSTFVHQFVVLRTQEHQVIETRLTTA